MEEKIVLQTEACRAEIALLGAQLESLQNAEGLEYLWQRDPKWWSGSAPVLFPMVGALRGGRTVIEGRIYEMPQHGLARRRLFRLISQTSREAVFSLCADKQTMEHYPFAFELQVRYTLEQASLRTSFHVFNHGAVPMPYAVGGHPAFNVPLAEGERFEEYAVVFEREETAFCPAIVVGEGLIDPSRTTQRLCGSRVLPLSHDLFYADALVFEGLISKTATLSGGSAGHGVTMEFSDFPMLGVWSAANDGPFVALEPWCGCATRTDETDEFTAKRWMRVLPAGQSETHSYTVTIF